MNDRHRANRSRVREHFHAALELDGEDRVRYLDDIAARDSGLRSEVEALLDATAGSEAYFERVSDVVSNIPLDGQLPQDRLVGSWRLLRLIGRGGMGSVYLAERADGEFQKRVAIKILPVGLGNEHSRDRFLQERQILARLVHDNIARLLDGGVTEDGTPFFVMDYVDGKPIDEYCEAHALDLRERMKLVLQVARGVQYAHRNLVIHRDLKPGNLLVEKNGHVRLLDFGIAKFLEPDEQVQLTQLAWRPATPVFSSPEMLSGAAVDITTDVYSIGVLMYLLITGKLPLSYDGLSMAAMQNRASTVEPSPVSQLNPRASRDLDAIVAQSLAKAPTDRYASVESLINDIENYLDGTPVAARVPSPWHRARLFVRRHRTAVSFAGLLAMSLAAIAAVSVRSAIVSKQQSEALSVSLERAEKTRDFLAGIFEAAGPDDNPGEVTAREILEAGVRNIETDLGNQPALQADLLSTIADVYGELGMLDEWQSVSERERAVRQAIGTTDDAKYIQLLLRLAEAVEMRGGGLDRQLELAREALERSRRIGDREQEGLALWRIARVNSLEGDYAAAEAGYREVLKIRLDQYGPESHFVGLTKTTLAAELNRQERYSEANEFINDAIRIFAALEADDPAPPRTDIYLIRAEAIWGTGQTHTAIALLEETLARNNQWYGSDNYFNLFVNNMLGRIETDRGNLEVARAYFRESLRLLDVNAPENPARAFALGYFAETHMLDGNCAAALPLLEEARQVLAEKLPTHWFGGNVSWRLGRCLIADNRFESAETHILSGIERLSQSKGPSHETTRSAVAAAVELYEAWGRPELAKRYRVEP